MADASAVRRPVAFQSTAWLTPETPLSRFVFRGDSAAQAAASAAFGVTLPQEACRATVQGDRAALWLGPDEFLLLATAEAGETISAAIGSALASQPHSLVDVSHRQVGLVVQGPRAEWLLESQCPLPLNLRDFPVGMCTRTIFSKAEIVLWRTTETSFHIEVWRSFSRYVVQLLHEVARELPA
jgi:sarcosine oxidase subunit gamma